MLPFLSMMMKTVLMVLAVLAVESGEQEGVETERK
jgi:hypothetical protein